MEMRRNSLQAVPSSWDLKSCYTRDVSLEYLLIGISLYREKTVIDVGNDTALKAGQMVQNDSQLHSLKHFYIETSSGPLGKGCSLLIQLQRWSYLLILPTCIREM